MHMLVSALPVASGVVFVFSLYYVFATRGITGRWWAFLLAHVESCVGAGIALICRQVWFNLAPRDAGLAEFVGLLVAMLAVACILGGVWLASVLLLIEASLRIIDRKTRQAVVKMYENVTGGNVHGRREPDQQEPVEE
jgi:hypothetical protein